MSDEVQINQRYAADQLAKALETAQTHGEPSTRERAEHKSRSWMQVLTGMASGLLDIGSRQPSKQPIWVTLEVLRGGFSTGNPLAGGPLTQHEMEMASERKLAPERSQLNRYFVTPAGLAELQTWLTNGHYRVDLPEEGALLTVAWLAQNCHHQQACELIQEIAPHFEHLRFYPIPAQSPWTTGTVQVQSSDEVSQTLSGLQNRPQFSQMREVIHVWLPFKDQLVSLLLETLEGGQPRIFQGKLEGGWPLQHYPEGWKGRALARLSAFKNIAEKHTLWKPNRDLVILLEVVEMAFNQPSDLTGRQVGKIRRILADYVRKRGLPGSPIHKEIRAEQTRIASLPGRADFVPVLLERLRTFDDIGPNDAREYLLAPTGDGRAIPKSLAAKLLRCWKADPESLVSAGVIHSGETLARVLPQISSQVPGSQFSNPEARRLFEASYVAFRKRRSLLLLRLQSQVKLEELPWITALLKHRDQTNQQFAKQSLVRFLTIYFKHWPHVILPNKLVRELDALIRVAQLDLPMLEQIAADIFMGAFSEKFLRAAKLSASLLRNTIYERYYQLDFSKVLQLNDLAKTYGTLSSPGLVALCEQQAGVKSGSSVVANGKVIEQAQILTSHNLAALWTLGLEPELSPSTLAKSCFSWICRTQSIRYRDWRSNLKARARCAHAWRQMVFYLSGLTLPEQEQFFEWAKSTAKGPRLDKTVRIWRHDLHRTALDQEGTTGPFLGWVTKAELNTP